MKIPRFLFVTLASVVTFAGCTKDHASKDSASSEAVPLFQAKKGIRLPDEMKKVLGVEIAEVSERPMQRQVRKMARVYREARAGAPAAAIATLTQEEARELKPGAEVRLSGGGDERQLAGKLTRLDPQSYAGLDQVEALLELTGEPLQLTVGTVVSVVFVVGEPTSVIAVPQAALLTAADGTFVYALNGEHFTRTKISTGAANEGFTEAKDGLYPGDVLVVKGVESLWLIELSALKGGTPCCAMPKKETASAK